MLNSVGARNFKCFEALDLELSSLTVLVGMNGSGKSTVMQVLELLRQSQEQSGVVPFPLVLNGPYVQMGFGQDILFEGSDGSEGIVLSVASPEGESSWRFRYESDSDVLAFDLEGKESSGLQSRLFTDRFQAISASRLGPQRSYERPDYEVRTRRRLGSAGEYWAHYLRVYGQDKVGIEGLLHPGSEGNTLVSQVDAWLGEISPGVRVSVEEAGAAGVITSGFAYETALGLTRSYSGPNVGFGLSYAIPVLVALLHADSESMLVLENPEAHLHPEGQLVMGRLMACAAAGGAQIIVETHSDHIVNGMRLAVAHKLIPRQYVRLYFFERDTDSAYPSPSITSIDIRDDGTMDPRPRGFFDQWERSLRHLLVARGGEDASTTDSK